MASKQQELRTNIVLGGKVDSSLYALSAQLEQVGSIVNTISRAVIKVGKESVEEYADYESAMKEVYALGNYTYADMEKLHQYNREIAQTTTYTNKEAANAELLLAQAGLDIEKTYQVLPSVLNLAMAGSLDMADSVDYLVTSLNALGLGMDSAETLTDQMAKTAALGMTDIDTLGESLMRLGSASSLYFKDSTEILTILSAMSQFGKDMRGSQGGTWLRNFALSLAAPTSNVDEMAEAMRELGESEEDIEEVVNGRSNGSAVRAIQALEEAGMQIYDAQGNLLPMIDIIKSLRNAVKGNGDYSKDLEQFASAFAAAGEDVDTFVNATDGLSNNALFTLMTQIFGKRGSTMAMNLISISDEEWDETYKEIEDSEGFAENAAEVMQGGLSGALAKLESAFSELKTTLGEHLAPDVENVANFLHDIITDVSNFDSATWDAITSGMEVVGAAGPAILLASMAFKAIAAVMNPVTAAALGATALVAALKVAGELEWAQFEDGFGNLDVSSPELTQYIDSLGDSFDTAYSKVNSFNDAVATAVSNYQTATATFKTDLITQMLTGETLTETDIANLEALGTTIYDSIIDGISNSTARDMAAVTATFGGEGLAEDSSVWASIIEVMNIGYEAAISQAQDLSQQLRDAMTSAFDDGILTPEEVADIQGIMDDMNGLLAIQTNADNYAAQQNMLRKAQTMGLDGLEELSELESERQQGVMEELYESQNTAYGTLAAYLDYMIENGMDYEGDAMTRERADEMLRELQEQQAIEAANYRLNFLPFTWRLYEEAVGSSDYGDAWDALKLGASDSLEQGVITQEELEAYRNSTTAEQRDRILSLTEWMVEAMGGYSALEDNIKTLTEMGDYENAGILQGYLQMLNFAQAEKNTTEFGYDVRGQASQNQLIGDYTSNDIAQQLLNINDGTMGYALMALSNAAISGDAGEFLNLINQPVSADSGYITALNNAVELAKSLEGFDEIEVPEGFGNYGDYYRMYKLAFGDQKIISGEQGIEVTDNGSGQELRNSLESTFNSPITQYIDVVTPNGGVAARTYNYKESSGGTSRGRTKYAEGGRASVASIFGEAGPEWAIPEEHTQRTAELLNAARLASGFSWPELLAETGGLNAGSTRNVSLTYSPTIVANDATDVETKLLQDKSRLERWLRERQLREEAEVYA